MSKCKILVPWWHVAITLTLCVVAAIAVVMLLVEPEHWKRVPAGIMLACSVGVMYFIVQ